MKGQRVGGRVGLFDPELAEQGKFLARLVPGPNRETASSDAEGLGVRPRAIEVRALKNRHVFEALLGPLENAQAGKAEVAQNRRGLQLAKVEIGRLVNHLLRHAVLDDVDRNRRRIDEAPMQRLKRKAEFLVAPDRGARHAPDRRVLIEREARKHAWQRRFRRLERFRGEFDRHLHDGVGGERNRLAQRFGGGGDEPDGANEAASAPPTASCKNSRRCLSAIVFFVRSPPNGTAQDSPNAASFPAKMISQPGGENRAASPTRSVLGQVVVYRFLRRSETHFAPRGQTAIAAACGWKLRSAAAILRRA